MTQPMYGSGAQETLMPASTIEPTASSSYTISISTTVSSTADTATGSIFNSQPIVVASFVVELADIAVDLLTLLLLIVAIFILLRLLHVYRRHKPSENEEGVVNTVQELIVTDTSDAATQTDAQTLSPVPVSPLIGELGVALQRRTKTIKQKSDTAIGTEWLPVLTEESLEPGTQSTSKQEQTQAATPSLDSGSLSCSSPVKLSTADKSPEVKPKEQPPVQETKESEIQSTPLLKTSASAPMLNLKKLSNKNTSKTATGSETLKLPKKKRFTLKKPKRYKQKEMENEVAEPVSQEEENPELVMLVKMVRLEGNEEDNEKITDL